MPQQMAHGDSEVIAQHGLLATGGTAHRNVGVGRCPMLQFRREFVPAPQQTDGRFALGSVLGF